MCQKAYEDGINWGIKIGQGLARDLIDHYIKDPKTHTEAVATLKMVFAMHRKPFKPKGANS